MRSNIFRYLVLCLTLGLGIQGCDKDEDLPKVDICEDSDLALQVVSTTNATSQTRGSIEVIATGGEGPYEYEINNRTKQEHGLFSNLSATNHNISVADVNGCETTITVAVQQDPPILSSLTLKLSEYYSIVGHPVPVELEVIEYFDNGENGEANDFDVLINGMNQGKLNEVSLLEPGAYQIKAISGEIESNTAILRMREDKVYDVKTFQIVFHIMHDGEEVGTGYNLSTDDINYQMELLESVYEDSDLALTPNSSYSYLDFELATVDPMGVPLAEPGITRQQRPSKEHSILFNDWMWDYYWDPDYYINVWVGDTKNGSSWGIYPWFDCAHQLSGLGCTENTEPFDLQGIALEKDNLWDGNWVFPHEIGHYFGLFHIFDMAVCDRDVDYCRDTRQYNRVAYENTASSNTRTSCEHETFVSHNIMDYWNQPQGGRDLTYDQRERVRWVVDHGKFRAHLNPSEGDPRDMSLFKQ